MKMNMIDMQSRVINVGRILEDAQTLLQLMLPMKCHAENCTSGGDTSPGHGFGRVSL